MLSLFVSLQSLAVTTKNRLSREETGATAVEYGLIIGLIAVAVVGALIALGPQIAGLFEGVTETIEDIPTPTP